MRCLPKSKLRCGLAPSVGYQGALWHFGCADSLKMRRKVGVGSSEPVLEKERIVAVGLLTQHDLSLLGHSFTRVWPVEDTPSFEGLIKAIDEAEREVKRAKEQSA